MCLLVYFVKVQLIAVRGTLGSLNECVAASIRCFISPFACFDDFPSQNVFNNSSKGGVLNSSMEPLLGRLYGRLRGVEHDGSSTYNK